MNQTKLGLGLGLLSYLLWGVLSLYWKFLGGIESYTVFSYRIVMTVVTMLVYMLLTGKTKTCQRELGNLWQNKRAFWFMVFASLAIAINWLTYIFAVSNGQAAEASLGYYIMPLVSIAFSVLFLNEQITSFGKLAVAIAAFGVCLLVFRTGHLPLVSLTLAISFGVYGLLKKGLPVTSDFAMLFEAGVALVVALPYLVLYGQSISTFSSLELIFLLLSGVVTAIPLLLFAEGVKRAPLNLIGFIQYINPTIQLLIALFVYNEVVSLSEWPAFLLIWLAVGVFMFGQLLAFQQETRK